MESKYREQGTLGSGYAEEGPYHCSDCTHKRSSTDPLCNHPIVVNDPDMQDRRQGDVVQINLQKGCCRFVHPPSVVALVMRHGETLLNEEGRLRSLMDVDIAPEGQQQAEEAAQFIIQNYPNVKRIITTPLKRTQQTVAPVAAQLGLTPEVDPSIITWNMGVLIGQKKDENKDVLDYFVENPDEQIPQGESLQQVLDRAMPTLELLLEQAEDAPITLICMTSSVIVPLIKYISGTPISEPGDDVGVGPGGIMAISVSGDGYTIKPVFGEVKPAEVGAS